MWVFLFTKLTLSKLQAHYFKLIKVTGWFQRDFLFGYECVQLHRVSVDVQRWANKLLLPPSTIQLYWRQSEPRVSLLFWNSSKFPVNVCTRPPGCQTLMLDRFCEPRWPRATSTRSEEALRRPVSLNSWRLRGKHRFRDGYLRTHVSSPDPARSVEQRENRGLPLRERAVLPHVLSLSSCSPGWKPQICLRDGGTCRSADGSRTRRRPITSSRNQTLPSSSRSRGAVSDGSVASFLLSIRL